MPSVWLEKRRQGYILRWRGVDGCKHASAAYPSKGDAIDAKHALIAKLGPSQRRRKAGPRPPEPLKIAAIIARWQEAKHVEAKKKKRHGADAYIQEAGKHAEAIAKKLHWDRPSDATKDSILRLKAEKNYRGVDRPLSYLAAVLRWSARELGTPLDVGVSAAMRSPPSQQADVDLMTNDQVQEMMIAAAQIDQEPLFSCLATYGWRAITACRLTVGDVRFDTTLIKIGIKRNGDWLHPLFPWHVEQMRKLAEGRGNEAPLFRNLRNEAWRIVDGSATQLEAFYRNNLRPDGGRIGGIHALRRLAITRMDAGDAPWKRRLRIAEIQLYTGLKTKEMVFRYMKTNIEHAREVMGQQGRTSGRGGATGLIDLPELPDLLEPPS